MNNIEAIDAKIDAKTKVEAENILTKLGTTPSKAITMFYREIIKNKSLPFEDDINIPSIDVSSLTKEEFENLIMEGINDIQYGRYSDVDTVFNEIYERSKTI